MPAFTPTESECEDGLRVAMGDVVALVGANELPVVDVIEEVRAVFADVQNTELRTQSCVCWVIFNRYRSFRTILSPVVGLYIATTVHPEARRIVTRL